MILVSIDPGKSGSVCVIAHDGAITFHDTPTVSAGTGGKREYDVQAMRAILAPFHARPIDPYLPHVPVLVALEKQQAMPAKLHGRSQGTVSSFSTGEGYGLWQGLIVGLGLSLELIHPRTWKAKMLADVPRDADGKQSKEASRLKALQLFPQCASDLKRKKDEARAEALLLGEFVKRYRLNAA